MTSNKNHVLNYLSLSPLLFKMRVLLSLSSPESIFCTKLNPSVGKYFNISQCTDIKL